MSTRHFNNLTPAEAERLALLAEEAAEVVKAAMKILRHGYESRHPGTGVQNREHLQEELGDLRAAQIIMFAEGDINRQTVNAASESKLKRAGQYLHHQKQGCP